MQWRVKLRATILFPIFLELNVKPKLVSNREQIHSGSFSLSRSSPRYEVCVVKCMNFFRFVNPCNINPLNSADINGFEYGLSESLLIGYLSLVEQSNITFITQKINGVPSNSTKNTKYHRGHKFTFEPTSNYGIICCVFQSICQRFRSLLGESSQWGESITLHDQIRLTGTPDR